MTQKQLELIEVIEGKAAELSQRSEAIAELVRQGDTPTDFMFAMLQSSRSAIDFWVDQLEAEIRGAGDSQ